MAAPGDSPLRLRFSLGEMMVLTGTVAVLLAGSAVGHSPFLALIAFFIVTQFLLRVLIALLPALGACLVGTGGPRELSEEHEARFREWTWAALRLGHEGRYTEALEALLAAESIRPGEARNALAQAWCLRKLGRPEDGTRPLERARVHAPLEPLLHFALACQWSQAGSVPLALDSLSMALELDPDLRECAVEEPDLEAIRGEEDYARLVKGPIAWL